MLVPSLGQEDPLEESMATHSSILAWRSPWTKKPGGLRAIRLQRVTHDWSDLACSKHKWLTGLKGEVGYCPVGTRGCPLPIRAVYSHSRLLSSKRGFVSIPEENTGYFLLRRRAGVDVSAIYLSSEFHNLELMHKPHCTHRYTCLYPLPLWGTRAKCTRQRNSLILDPEISRRDGVCTVG